jgi:hypothetical protein
MFASPLLTKSGAFMRTLACLSLVFVCFLTSTAAQQVPAAPSQDAQAVSLLNHVLTATGGQAAVNAILDYKAFGTITYPGTQNDVHGSVTVAGLGTSEFRLDATLPTGVRSWAIHKGQTTIRADDGTVSLLPPVPSQNPSDNAFPYHTPMFPGSVIFPYGQVVAVLGNPLYRVSYKGISTIDGHSMHDIEVQRILPGEVDPPSKYDVRDFFIDISTLQVVMTQDMIPRNVLHQIWYSDYRSEAGLLVPFSISEKMGGQQTWSIQLSNITFNVGLQDSTFQL